MLAYTTLSDLFDVPSALEVAVYLGGLLLVLALPTLYVILTSLRNRSDADSATQQNVTR
ncbi:MAG: hypothetical protein AAF171_26390 [Cyanobacteria bacterium P01_A01_bin.116]